MELNDLLQYEGLDDSYKLQIIDILDYVSLKNQKFQWKKGRLKDELTISDDPLLELEVIVAQFKRTIATKLYLWFVVFFFIYEFQVRNRL